VIETLVLLLAAHLLADFPLQPDRLIRRKRNPLVLAGHLVIVAGTACVLLGTLHWPLLAVLLSTHLAMDALKVYVLRDTPVAFLLDQAVHVVVILALAMAFPEVWRDGWWALLPAEHFRLLMVGVVVASGIIATLQPGAILIRKATEGFARDIPGDTQGLKDGGRYIGYLERLLVLMLVLAGQFAGVGFLITAKSILRFGDLTETRQRKLTEYIIIGTFMSFGWGLLVALLTQAGVSWWLQGAGS
jgi:hypothetical protein